MSLRTVFSTLALVAAMGVAALAQGTHQVTILKSGNGEVTIAVDGGAQHVLPVAADAKITFDGKACKLEEIRSNSPATVTGARINDQKTITSIDARSK